MKISVIIPCYSVGTNFVEEAIESVQNQTYSNWEIIFVDDCSPLKEWKSEKLNSIPKEKLKIINNKENVGLAQSRNIGFNNSSGDLILFLDADDKYAKNNFFKYLIEKFEKYPDLDLISFNCISFYEDNNDFRKRIKKVKVDENYYKNLSFRNFNDSKIYKISSWSYCIKKSFLLKNNIMHLNKKTANEDYVFIYQIIWNNHNLIVTSEIFYMYRKRENSITHSMKKKKYYEIEKMNIILNDIYSLKLRINEQDICIYVSRLLLASLIKYGYKKNKNSLNLPINKNTYKDLCILFKDLKLTKVNLIIRFKLKWIVFIIYKIYYLFSK